MAGLLPGSSKASPPGKGALQVLPAADRLRRYGTKSCRNRLANVKSGLGREGWRL